MNQLSAVESKFALSIALIVFILGGVALTYIAVSFAFETRNVYTIIGIVSVIGIPAAIYMTIEKEERNKIRRFNNFKVSE